MMMMMMAVGVLHCPVWVCIIVAWQVCLYASTSAQQLAVQSFTFLLQWFVPSQQQHLSRLLVFIFKWQARNMLSLAAWQPAGCTGLSAALLQLLALIRWLLLPLVNVWGTVLVCHGSSSDMAWC
jgi:hypothetical protein